MPKSAFALVNKDDKRGLVMLQNCTASHYTFAQKFFWDYQIRVLENALSGLHLSLNEYEFMSRFVGDFNAHNLAVVFGVADLLGESVEGFYR